MLIGRSDPIIIFAILLKFRLICNTQPPYELVVDHIISWTNEGDVVLDPMCGSGTTCVAAYDFKRNYIGMDISVEYCELAKERIKLHSMNPTLF